MAKRAYVRTGLTGGGNALDGIDGAELSALDQAVAWVMTGGRTYPYMLSLASGATPDGLTVIAPAANAGSMRWLLNMAYADAPALSLITAANDFFVGSDPGAVAKKTLAETQTILLSHGFSANKNSANQTLSHNIYTKIIFGAEEWDSDGWYDASNSRFQPQVAGKYLVVVRLSSTATTAVNDRIRACIYKNGSVLRHNSTRSTISTDDPGAEVMSIVDLNGTTDYIEAYGQAALAAGSGTLDISGNPVVTYFQATRV